MENDTLKQEIDALITELGDNISIARPAADREVIEKIRLILDSTREQRTGSARSIWETYLPYAAKRCDQLTRLEEGWEEALEYFASENAQFWLDDTAALLEKGEIAAARDTLGRILEACRLVKQDRVFQVDILLHALDHALEISDKKSSIRLYEEADKVYRKHLAGGAAYAGSAWLPKIKKMSQQLRRLREQLRRYYHYAETVTVSVSADSEADLVRVIEYLQQSLVGKVTVTRRVKAADEPDQSGADRYRARLKITLE